MLALRKPPEPRCIRPAAHSLRDGPWRAVLAACGATPEPEVIVQVETVVVEQTKIIEKEGETACALE